MMQKIWSRLAPKHKRFSALGGAIIAVLFVVWITSPDNDENDSPTRGRQETIKHVLTDKSTREVGIDSLGASLRLLERKNRELEREMDKMRTSVTDSTTKSEKAADLDREVTRLRDAVEALKVQNQDLHQQMTESQAKHAETERHEGTDSSKQNHNEQNNQPSIPAVAEGDVGDPASYFANAPVPDSRDEAPSGNETDEGPINEGLSITSYSSKQVAESESSTKQEEIMYLPSGSILTGTLINGLDAPTGQAARREPFPSTLRIQKEAILPNRFRADIRECFLILSGYGDLSSERAYLRGENLSCVRNDGSVIETPIDSYAVGEDGKAGVRGRLVSKQGQLITRSLMAGFMGGMAEAFNVRPVPVINTNASDQVDYQEVFSDQTLQAGAVQGASRAMERIADFYIEMAEGIFPVIEVDAGRQVDIIVKKGVSLKAK